MVINENLYTGPRKVEIKALDNNANYQEVIIPDGLIDGERYTISADISQKNGKGVISYVIFDKDIRLRGEFVHAKINGKTPFTFNYKSELTHKILLYSGQAGNTRGISTIYSNIKIEKGEEATPYIPSKNSLDPSKQSVFKAGGVFQEVYPL